VTIYYSNGAKPSERLNRRLSQLEKRMNRTDNKAFTLVELLIVALIPGALATIVIPRIMGGSKAAKVSACKTNVDILNTQIELYYVNEGAWPTDIRNVTDDPNYFPDEGPRACPFGLDYSYNSSTNRVNGHNH
jgi:prepilin-type N-terminal cleavage/methylation domain-containing protein